MSTRSQPGNTASFHCRISGPGHCTTWSSTVQMSSLIIGRNCRSSGSK